MSNTMTIEELKTFSEMQLREGTIEWPKSSDELLAIINAVTDREHDYGTCAAAMSIAAVAAFYYVSTKLSVTGFQASCADLDFIRRTRNYQGSFILLDIMNMVYPQYDLHEKLQEIMDESMPLIQDKAQALLEEERGHVHPRVLEHWKKLAADRRQHA